MFISKFFPLKLQTSRVALLDLTVCMALMGLALVTFCFRLTDIPFALHGDVGEIAEQARKMNSLREFVGPSAWWHIPGAMFIPQSIAFHFGYSLFLTRLPDALFGVSSSVMLYFLLRRAYTPLIAASITTLTICSPQVIQTFRVALGHGLPFLLPILFLLAMEWAWSGRKLGAFAVGLVLASSMYVYLPARLLLVVFFVLVFIKFLRRTYLKRSQSFRVAAIAAVVVLIAVLPLAYLSNFTLTAFFPRGEHLALRTENWPTLVSNYKTTSIIAIIFGQLTRAIGASFWIPSLANGDFYLSDGGFFEGALAVLGVIGIIFIWYRPHRIAKWSFCGLLTGTIFLGALLVGVPSYNRMISLFPFWIVLAAHGLFTLVSFSILRYSQVITTLLVLLLTAVQSVYSVNKYVDLANRSNDWWYWSITELGHFIGQYPGNTTQVFFERTDSRPGYIPRYGIFRLLAPGVPISKWPSNEELSCQRLKELQKILLVTPADTAKITQTELFQNARLNLNEILKACDLKAETSDLFHLKDFAVSEEKIHR